MAVDAKLSKLVRNQFPDFYKEEGENFLAFMEAYYAYLEENGKMTDAIRNLQSYRDISTTTDEFIQYFINQFLPNAPIDFAADKKLAVKYINQYNTSRGTLASYKLFFRALYNENVDVEYPADQILKVSDGDWRKDRYLVAPYDPSTYQFIGKTITGTESGAEALVEDIVRKNVRGRDIQQILLSNIKGSFNHFEPIRLKTDVNGSGHNVIVEAGIALVDILSAGGEYVVGDVVDLVSPDKGLFGKVVVTGTQDLGGTLTFSLVDGGSGFTSETDVTFIGGDGTEEGSFVITESDIVDRFALAININLLQSNTIYGEGGALVTYADSSTGIMDTLANTLISAPDYGFPEQGQLYINRPYRDHKNAVITVANTKTISQDDDLFGETSQANGVILEVIDGTAGATVLRIDAYKNFTPTETVNNGIVSIGTVTTFQGNTIGHHVLEVGNVAGQTISEGDEIVGLSSNAFGVVKRIVADTANGYPQGVGGADDRNLVTLHVTANTSANLTSQFDTGPMKAFLENEGLRKVGSVTVIGNSASTTANTETEHLYTKLSDAFVFETSTFGTIASLSLPVGGSGYSVAPTITVRENDIASLGIGEQYITIQSDDPNWGTGNSAITKLDSNDRVLQTAVSASGDVKGGFGQAQPDLTIHANGTYESTLRVWQDFNQRKPNNIEFANNSTITLKVFDSSYVPGEQDTRTPVATGTAKVVRIIDEGVLGENASITAGVGANGTITGIRVLDSGFCYRDKEIVLIEATNRNLATSARVQLTLQGAANSEGYYATTRSHISSLRGYIQDSEYYQEYSYQIVSPISLDRYRDYALELVHPAGQALFGKFRSQSNVEIDVVTSANNTAVRQGTGTVQFTQGSFDIVGTNTLLDTEYANGDILIVEHQPKQFYSIPINSISSNTSANLTIAWSNNTIASANVFYKNELYGNGMM